MTVTLETAQPSADILEMWVEADGVVLYSDTLANTREVSHPQYAVPYIFTTAVANANKLDGKKVSVVVRFAGGSEYVVLSRVLNFGGEAADDGIVVISYDEGDKDDPTTNLGHGVKIIFKNQELIDKIASVEVHLYCKETGEIIAKPENINGNSISNIKKDALNKFYIPQGTAQAGSLRVPFSQDAWNAEHVWTVRIYAAPKAGMELEGEEVSGKVKIKETELVIGKRGEFVFNVIGKGNATLTLKATNTDHTNGKIHKIEGDLVYHSCGRLDSGETVQTVNNVAYLISKNSGIPASEDIIEQWGYQNQGIKNDTEKKIYTSFHDETASKYTLDLNNPNYEDGYYLQVYLGVNTVPTRDKNTCLLAWYLIGEKTIGELKQDINSA